MTRPVRRAAWWVLVLLAAPASGQTHYTWDGGVGAWLDPASWSPTGVPGSGAQDSVDIFAGTVTLAGAPPGALGRVRVSSGATLSLSGGGWTFAARELEVGGADAGAALRIDDDDTPGGLITLS